MTTPEMIAPDCLIGFSFGAGKNGLPGKSNEMLAMKIVQYVYSRPLPLLLQREIFAGLKYQPGIIAAKVIAARENRTYLDAREVARQACEVMQQNGWRTCIIAAHKDHLPRCAAVMKKFGIHVAETLGTGLYDVNSAQWWTTRPFLFKPFNALKTIYYKQRGWI